jgi:hypothetical protein
MKGRHHTPEQIIRKLAECEKLLGEDKSIEDVCRHLEISESTGMAGEIDTAADTEAAVAPDPHEVDCRRARGIEVPRVVGHAGEGVCRDRRARRVTR